MKRLLAGVKVVDFTWIGAGSYTTRLLADLGADVIKIESTERLDSLRLARPFKDGVAGVNRSGYFADRNCGKRSITINAKHAEGLQLTRCLIAQSDLVTNNFTPGVMDKLGLGYDAVKAIAPRIVYAAMSMQGDNGPHRQHLGYGLTIGAMTGFQHLTGLPEREPAGTGTNFPDHIPNPTHAAFAILSALRHARRAGVGQYIDIAQTEPTIAVLGASILHYTLNGEVDQRHGNAHVRFAPHGVYPCAGDDRWIAIAVTDEARWTALRGVLDIADEAGWRGNAARLADQQRIDAVIAEKTRAREAVKLMHDLQAAGIAAGAVQDARDVLQHDPQLRARGHWVRLDHPEMGPSTYNAAPFRFSGARSEPLSPAPLLGEHTRDICRDLLGLDEQEIDRLIAVGALA